MADHEHIGKLIPAVKAPTRGGDGLSVRLLVWILRGIRVGRLNIVLPNGRQRRLTGAEPGPAATLKLVRKGPALHKILGNGAIGFGEAYMAGDWDSPDLTTLLRFMAVNEPYLQGPYERNVLGRVLQYLGHRLRHNSRRGSRRNIAHHYDLGNDFYRLWLDPGMTYSGAIFARPDQLLAAAQDEKYRLLLERLDLQPHHHLLEIGSGWGGFALFAAREVGCRVTSITLSREQLDMARERADEAGLSEHVSFQLCDYRDITGEYDRIASIEMYEAVGREYWPQYFRVLRQALRPGGRAAIQGITIDGDAFKRYCQRADFIQKYIFPGGMLAPPEVFIAHAEEAGLSVSAPAFYGKHYADTLARWHGHVLASRERIARRFDERFVRMWRYYLAYCECGFRVGRIDLMHVTLHKPAPAPA